MTREEQLLRVLEDMLENIKKVIEPEPDDKAKFEAISSNSIITAVYDGTTFAFQANVTSDNEIAKFGVAVINNVLDTVGNSDTTDEGYNIYITSMIDTLQSRLK